MCLRVQYGVLPLLQLHRFALLPLVGKASTPLPFIGPFPFFSFLSRVSSLSSIRSLPLPLSSAPFSLLLSDCIPLSLSMCVCVSAYLPLSLCVFALCSVVFLCDFFPYYPEAGGGNAPLSVRGISGSSAPPLCACACVWGSRAALLSPANAALPMAVTGSGNHVRRGVEAMYHC